MTRMIEAIQKMVKLPSEIRNVVSINDELYFNFKGHTFSLIKRDHEYQDMGYFSFYVYPGNDLPFDQLARNQEFGEPTRIVAYHAAEIGERLLEQLHRILTDKLYNIDAIVDDILGDDDIAF